MARNPLCHSLYNFKQKMSQLLSSFPLWSSLYLRESLWNTLGEFPRYLPLILRYKSLILIDSQRPTEIVFVVHRQTLHKISNFLLTSEKTLLENLTGERNATNISSST